MDNLTPCLGNSAPMGNGPNSAKGDAVLRLAARGES